MLTVVVASTDVKVHGKGPKVEPRWVPTGSISEATEGLLVQLVGVGPIEPDSPFGTILHLDDGSGPIRVFVCTSTGIDLSGLATGQQVSVTGMIYQFIDYEVDPGSRATSAGERIDRKGRVHHGGTAYPAPGRSSIGSLALAEPLSDWKRQGSLRQGREVPRLRQIPFRSESPG